MRMLGERDMSNCERVTFLRDLCNTCSLAMFVVRATYVVEEKWVKDSTILERIEAVRFLKFFGLWN